MEQTRLPTPLDYTETMNAEAVRRLILQLFEHPLIKVSLSGLAFYVDWMFGAQKESLVIIGLLVFLDALTGFMRAYRKCRISSAGFFKTAVKCFVYFILLTTGACVDKTSPFPFALVTMAAYLSVTEAISIIENLGAMGYSVPSVLIGRLKALKDLPQTKEEKTDGK